MRVEGLGRIANKPVLHEFATWANISALFVVLVPFFVAVVVLAFLSLRERMRSRHRGNAWGGESSVVPMLLPPYEAVM